MRAANKLIDAHYLEIEAGPFLIEKMGQADLAYVLSLVENDLIPKGPGKTLIGLLVELSQTSIDLDPELGDLYKNRDNWLKQHDRQAAGWLSFGRARRESSTVAFHLCIREQILCLAECLADLAVALADVAKENTCTYIFDYTYLKRAQPTSFSHYILGFGFPVIRDAERLLEAFNRANLYPGGIGSTNGSLLDIDRESLSQSLGFHAPLMHTRDGMWAFDIPVEIMSLCSSISLSLNRLCNDLQIFYSDEFDLVELNEQYTRGSVIMPNKKNPYGLAFIRGLSSQIAGKHLSVMNAQNTMSGQIDNRIIPYLEVPTALEKTTLAVKTCKEIVTDLQVKSDKDMCGNNDLSVYATDIAQVISIQEQIDYTTAHEVLRRSDMNSQNVEQFLASVANAFNSIVGRNLQSVSDLQGLLKPESSVEARQGLGAASTASVNSMLASLSEDIANIKNVTFENLSKITKTEVQLFQRAKALFEKD